MGSENLFHKRKAVGLKDLDLDKKRKKQLRKERFLIVCEGSKTEPNYLIEMKILEKLPTVNIKIYGKECGSDPMSIVKFAIEKYEENTEEDNPIDKVYCVFDRDKHDTFDQAINTINQKGKNFIAIVSDPCFEYWLIIHYEKTRKPYHAKGKKSVGNVVEKYFRENYMKNYRKGMTGLYAFLRDKLFSNAMIYAEIAKNDAIKAGSTNPSTDFHILIKSLLSLK